jgi:hypothetical protein
LRHDGRAHQHAWQQAYDDRQDAPPHVGQRVAVHPQDVGIERDLDRYERGIEHAIREKDNASGTVIDEKP